ncbi:hypothetical protein TNCT_666181 [Trichonephila clavata]|uniref:Uncharacterized protein n=1 Tax=Trichonephila clavata TaxID=2740835 RepID=A0A8X6L1P0_TRICU|nr:hypothetical protein TNCT_666181 [Trichonephila clavata]
MRMAFSRELPLSRATEEDVHSVRRFSTIPTNQPKHSNASQLGISQSLYGGYWQQISRPYYLQLVQALIPEV